MVQHQLKIKFSKNTACNSFLDKNVWVLALWNKTRSQEVESKLIPRSRYNSECEPIKLVLTEIIRTSDDQFVTSIKGYRDRVKAKAKAKILFDVCRSFL